MEGGGAVWLFSLTSVEGALKNMTSHYTIYVILIQLRRGLNGPLGEIGMAICYLPPPTIVGHTILPTHCVTTRFRKGYYANI